MKDKVYAIVELANDADGFDVDYNKPFREVFLDVVRFAVTNNPWGRQLDFLGTFALIKAMLLANF